MLYLNANFLPPGFVAIIGAIDGRARARNRTDLLEMRSTLLFCIARHKNTPNPLKEALKTFHLRYVYCFTALFRPFGNNSS